MKEKILIIAKTCPCKSKKYGELVCTAGITQNNELIRLYLISFKNLNKKQKYTKYQYIEVDIKKDITDPRKESFKIISNIQPLEKIDTKNNWYQRKNIILKNHIFNDKKIIINNCRDIKNGNSLLIFKPEKIKSFIITNNNNNEYVPFKFYYKFSDINNNLSKLQIIDWEIFVLTNKLLKKFKDIKIVKDKLKAIYFDYMNNRDLYLFLGTNRQWHIRKSHNPFMIIGLFYPPKIS